MGGPHGAQASTAPGAKQSQLPMSDPQSRTAKRSRGTIKRQRALEQKVQESVSAVNSLLTETEGFLEAEGLEKTYKFTQADILENVSEEIGKKAFRLGLSFGPYFVDYTRGGRHLLLGGQKGNLGVLDCHEMKTICEVNVKETVRSVCFLQNHTLWAAAQKKYVYIYDNQGIEVHCLRDLMLTYSLSFLPYHYLMVSIGEFGELNYYDISTGQIAAKHRTKRGPCGVMAPNPTNAVMHLGHTKGTVTLWTPNLGKPAVDMLCHKGKVTALAAQDQYMVTAGVDGKWKLWDLRKYEAVQSFNYFGSPPSCVSISQTGLVGLGFGSHVQIWKDVLTQQRATLYLTHEMPGEQVSCLAFRPFEDVCAYGSTGAVGTLLVPGAGLANYDSRDANPYETKKQRQEREIHSLLEKIPADMISLDTTPIGTYDKKRKAAPVLPPEPNKDAKKPKKQKKKQRGRDAAEKRSRKNEREHLIHRRQQTALRLSAARNNKNDKSEKRKETITGALARFVKK
ncbi:WD domain, G-beta repeat-containing protein, putative [Eimeria necatrix]|uniref:WD domain, G-beta repeat-containing protein, putative n=1 Tax=Eimeria necatrix TaxID=51315 RepID=U6MNR1_9EIME|nr:WD domain, G-beta repeat-containing protein, putative [Eimeria necatrix]CDJ65646.1 WD domain, G-beta repeat-containing protein, putative [Eimeria necatrix]